MFSLIPNDAATSNDLVTSIFLFFSFPLSDYDVYISTLSAHYLVTNDLSHHDIYIGTLLLFSCYASILFDFGATHSFISNH